MFKSKEEVFGHLDSAISFEDLKKLIELANKYDKKILSHVYPRISVPCSVLSSKLSSLESIVKYLRDELKLSNNEVCEILARKKNTISMTYKKATLKFSGKMDMKSEYHIPASIIKNEKFSVLENIVLYLKLEYNLTNKLIGDALGLNSKTIWTILNRAGKKWKS